MDHIDPTSIKGFQPPMTAEIASEFKKKIKESKMDTFEESIESEDVVSFSEATEKLPEKKKEAFLADAKSEIKNLDPDSETFMDEATEKLVNSALKWEFGSKLMNNPGYKQMEQVIRKKLSMDSRYRPIIEDFLGKLLESE
jgi:hypothetical protein